ncbi:MAG: sensor histidine kinase [Erysipelotrichaceae bacterium]
MKIKDLILDKLYLIIYTIFIVIFLYFFCKVTNASSSVTIMIIISLLSIDVCVLLVEYYRRYSFYKELNKTSEGIDNKVLIHEIVDEPSFYDGIRLFDTLRITDRYFHEQIHAYEIDNREYREYIEMWVHEIKTPLAASKLIIENSKNDTTISINNEIEKVEDYVEQALFYARSNSVEKDYIIKELNLMKQISNVIKKNSRSFILKNIAINITNCDVNVFSDEKWLSFILNQIIGNSLKYTPNNGKIDINTTIASNSLLLKINDNGIGVLESELDRLFNKGFTGSNGRNVAKSTGMGLYLCKKLCTKLNSNISASINDNNGLCITINFPLSNHILMK